MGCPVSQIQSLKTRALELDVGLALWFCCFVGEFRHVSFLAYKMGILAVFP